MKSCEPRVSARRRHVGPDMAAVAARSGGRGPRGGLPARRHRIAEETVRISYVESERGRPCRPKAVLTCEDSHVTRILWTATKKHSTECRCSSSTASAGCTSAASPRTPPASGQCSRPQPRYHPRRAVGECAVPDPRPRIELHPVLRRCPPGRRHQDPADCRSGSPDERDLRTPPRHPAPGAPRPHADPQRGASARHLDRVPGPLQHGPAASGHRPAGSRL